MAHLPVLRFIACPRWAKQTLSPTNQNINYNLCKPSYTEIYWKLERYSLCFLVYCGKNSANVQRWTCAWMWLQTPRHAGVANAWYTHWMHVTVAGQILFNMIYNTDTINWLHYWKNKVNVVLHTMPLTTLDPRGHPTSAQTYSNHYFFNSKSFSWLNLTSIVK